MTNPVQIVGTEGRGPSYILWDKIPWRSIKDEFGEGFFYQSDLMDFPVLATATAQGPWYVVFDTSNTPYLDATTEGGVVKLLTDGTDNDEMYLKFGAGKGSFMKFEAGKKLVYETRIKLSSVTNDRMPSFVGLGEEGIGAADYMADDTGVPGTPKDFVGFGVDVSDGDSLNVVYSTESGAIVTEDDVIALAADTWYNLGIYCDGTTVFWYVDDVEVHSALLTATNFPDGEELVPFWAFKNTSANAMSMSIDWFRACKQS